MTDTDPTEDFLGPPDLNLLQNGSSPTAADYFPDIEIRDIPPGPEPDERPFADATQPLGDGTCLVCGSPTFRPPGLTAAGHKKRVPKYCDLHAKNVTVSPERPNLKGVESQLQRIQEELADDLRLLATLAGPLLPVTGMYLFEAADPFTISILKLAKNNTRIIRVLHRAAQVAPIYTVAETVAGTAYAIQVDTKGADPHSTIGKRLKVERAYNAIYPDEQVEQPAPFTGPPRYSGVQ